MEPPSRSPNDVILKESASIEDLEMSKDTPVCRICMSEMIKYCHLHRKGIILGEVTSLASLLSYALCVDVTDDPRLPSSICEQCVRMIAKSYLFKKKILESNDILEGKLLVDELEKAVDEEDTVEQHDSESMIHEEAEELQELAKVALSKEDDHQLLHRTDDESDVVVEVGTECVAKEDGDDEDNHLAINETHEEEVVVQEEEEEDEGEEVTNDGEQPMDHDDEMEYPADSNTDCLESGDSKGYLIEEADEDEESKFISETYEVVTLANDEDDVQVLKKRKATEILKTRKPPKTRSPRTETKTSNPAFQCMVCHKQLSNLNSFKYHMQLHSDQTPYLCSLCGEGFKTRNAYDGHMIIHDPNNPNTCELCGKSYRQQSSLRTHMLQHTGEKPFECDICGKKLTQKSGYKKHMLIHTGEKPHVCDICNREFRYSSNLIAHRRCHSGQKPYECPDCHKGFSTPEQMRRHRLVHTEQRPFGCDLCDKKFKRRNSLLIHRSTHETQAAFVDQKVAKSNVVELY